MSEKHDSNPMHEIGHGRGDEHAPRKTATYSFVAEHLPKKSSDSIPEMKILTVKDVIADLIEKDVGAWKALPKSVQNALMDRPADFQFISAPVTLNSGISINILYNGTIWRWVPMVGSWIIHEIVR